MAHDGAPRRLAPRLLRTVVRAVPTAWLSRVQGVRAVYNFLDDLAWAGINETIWEIEGSKMYLDPWDGSPMRRTFRSYLSTPKEPETARLFKEVIRPGDTVVDIGANVGFFSLLAARLVGTAGRVYAFEPEPQNFALLTKNIALNGYTHVVAYRKAVWRRAGLVKLYLSNALDTGAHTLRPKHATRYFDQDRDGHAIEVECVVLDAFLAPGSREVSSIGVETERAVGYPLGG